MYSFFYKIKNRLFKSMIHFCSRILKQTFTIMFQYVFYQTFQYVFWTQSKIITMYIFIGSLLGNFVESEKNTYIPMMKLVPNYKINRFCPGRLSFVSYFHNQTKSAEKSALEYCRAIRCFACLFGAAGLRLQD